MAAALAQLALDGLDLADDHTTQPVRDERRDARHLHAGVDQTIGGVLSRELEIHELTNPAVRDFHWSEDSAAGSKRRWAVLDAEWLRSALNRWPALDAEWLRSAVNAWPALDAEWLHSAVNRWAVLDAEWLRSALNRRSAVNRKWLRRTFFTRIGLENADRSRRTTECRRSRTSAWRSARCPCRTPNRSLLPGRSRRFSRLADGPCPSRGSPASPTVCRRDSPRRRRESRRRPPPPTAR